MAVEVDPEHNETHALFDLVNFHGQHVLEIGCGDGRLTWRYANRTAYVTAIDPNEDRIKLAKQNTPPKLEGLVEFHTISFEDFAHSSKSSIFDHAIFAWSF